MNPIPSLRSCVAMTFAAALVTACGGGSRSLAEDSQPSSPTTSGGATPFIASADLTARRLDRLHAVRMSVAPKAGATAQPVQVVFEAGYLRRRGFLDAASGRMHVPVFGLYAGRRNHVTITLEFDDGSAADVPVVIDAPAYVDPNATFDRPLVRIARSSTAAIGFSYFFMKSALGTPVVVDSDAEVRWVGVGVGASGNSALVDNSFVVGVPDIQLRRLDLDGTVTDLGRIQSTTYTAFHHNFDSGKAGVLVEVDASSGGVSNVESVLAEVNSDGAILHEWDFKSIVRDLMTAGGDDPTLFVRDGADWFHMNAATYDPRDDAIVVSSRENFVIKVDYQTGQVKWIFGDPSKYWYTFASLRAKSLSLATGGLYPIGQHGISILPAGELLLFNNGQNSTRQPVGAPAGEQRTYSAVSAYTIDPVTMSATDVWRFDYGQSIMSSVCSSAYRSADGSTLVTYAAADNLAHARLVGLDAQRNVVFDFQYDTAPCAIAWNGNIIPLEAMVFR